MIIARNALILFLVPVLLIFLSNAELEASIIMLGEGIAVLNTILLWMTPTKRYDPKFTIVKIGMLTSAALTGYVLFLLLTLIREWQNILALIYAFASLQYFIKITEQYEN